MVEAASAGGRSTLLGAPGDHRLQQVAVGAADVQEAAVAVDRLAEVAAVGPPGGGRAAEPRPASRGPGTQVRRLHQPLAVAVPAGLVEPPAGLVGRLDQRGRALVPGGPQPAGGLGRRALPELDLGVGPGPAVAVVALAPDDGVVAGDRERVQALAAEPGGDQRHPQPGVEHRVLAGQHLPRGQGQAAGDRDQRAATVGQERHHGQPPHPLPADRARVHGRSAAVSRWAGWRPG